MKLSMMVAVISLVAFASCKEDDKAFGPSQEQQAIIVFGTSISVFESMWGVPDVRFKNKSGEQVYLYDAPMWKAFIFSKATHELVGHCDTTMETVNHRARICAPKGSSDIETYFDHDAHIKSLSKAILPRKTKK